MSLLAAHEAIVREYTEKRDTYVSFTEGLRDLIADLCAKHQIISVRVDGRAKTVDSLVGKFARYPDTTRLDEFPDLAGVRVVVFRPDDVRRVRQLLYEELSILEQEYHGDSSVETFGYRGLHLMARLDEKRASLGEWREFAELKAEVQVHTALQNAWSSISHDLDYKAREHVPAPVRRVLFRLAALLETCDDLLLQFCREVEEVQSEYARAISEGKLEDVPLDLESIRLAWATLTKTVHTSFTDANGGDRSGIQLEPPGTDTLARLLDLLDLCGIDTLAGLYQHAAEIQQVSDGVNEIALDGSDYAMPAETMLAVGLLLTRPSLHDDAHLWIGTEVASSLRKVAARRGLEGVRA